MHDERLARRQRRAAELAQPLLPPGVEALHESRRRPHSELERRPPLLEARMLHRDRQRRLLEPADAGLGEELGEMAGTGTRSLGFLGRRGVELVGGDKERRQRPLAAGRVIPDTRRDDAPPNA